MRILIAEDDITTRAILTTVVVKAGYEPLTAVDGDEAWAELQKPNPPKLVILDWLMPGMDGLEVAQRARRELSGDAPLYILMLTSRSAKEDVITGLEAGVDDYLVKPFSVKELLARVAIGRRMVNLLHDVHQERGRLRAVIESSRDGLIMVSAERRLMLLNQPAAHLLQLPGGTADWLGRDLSQLTAALPGDSSEVAAFIAAPFPPDEQLAGDSATAVATTAAVSTAAVSTAAVSTAVVAELTASGYAMRCESLPVMAGEAWLGQLFVLRDVTEERAVAKMRANLIRTMVHDLRNPLTAISGALELLNAMVDANWETHSVKLMEAASLSSHQMLTLVSGILDIDRLESGQTPVFMQSFNLREVAAWECATQKPLALAKRIQLTYQLPDNLPPAWGDRETIRRVLQNLLGNALKFTPDNGRVHLEATQTERDGEPALEVTVQDSGPGIDPELGERLFAQFAAGRHPEAGSGLGLAYCKLALDAHDQQIWAGNAPKNGAPKNGAPKNGPPEGGAIFTFTLAVAPDFPEVSRD